MVSCSVELLAVELVMLFFVEIEIKKREIPQNDQFKYHRRVAKNTLLCRVEIHVHENSQTGCFAK